MRIWVTIEELTERGLLERACEILDISVQVVLERQTDGSDALTFSSAQAFELGLIKVDGGQIKIKEEES